MAASSVTVAIRGRPRRTHVAFVINTLGGGGAERSTLNLARGLVDRGHTVDLLTFADEVVFRRELSPQVRLFKVNLQRRSWYGRRVRRIKFFWRYRRKLLQILKCRTHSRPRPATAMGLFRMLRGERLEDVHALVEYIDQEKPDCILPSLARSKVSTLLARRFTEWNPIVIPIVRNVMMRRTKRTRHRYRVLFPFADRFVAISKGVGESMVQHLNLPSSLITCIYNPIDIRSIESLSIDLPVHPWMMDGGTPVIVSVGRLVSAKDFPTLLKAVAELRTRIPVRLIILGEGPCREGLEKLVSELALQDSVLLPGWVDNPFSFMRRASAFVLSSKWEGLGNVLIEALACGCPCVSTNCPSGPSEILDEGRVGPLVPIGDSIALADAICSVVANPPDVEMLRAQAAKFSFQESIDNFERLILTTRHNRKEPGASFRDTTNETSIDDE